MISPARHAVYRRSRTLSWVLTGGAVAVLCAAVATIVVTYARLVVTPSRSRPDDVQIIGVDLLAGTVTLSADADTRAPGNYSLWFSQNRGHARLGSVLAETHTTVTRALIVVDFGELQYARTGRLGGWVYLFPKDLPVSARNIALDSDVGVCPAWLIPARAPAPPSPHTSRANARALGHPGARSRRPTFRDPACDAGISRGGLHGTPGFVAKRRPRTP